jgi:hypothetical protein
VTDTGVWNPRGDQTFHAVPGQMMLVTAASQHFLPQTAYFLSEDADRWAVHGYTIAPGVTRHHRPQISPLLRNGIMHAFSKLGVDFLQLSCQLFAHRLSKHRELPLPRLSTYVHESQEVEGFRFPLPPFQSILGGKTSKLDQAGLVRMDRQTELCKPLSQLLLKSPSIFAVLKPHDEIVRKADDNHIAASLPLPPLLDPQIEYIVEITAVRLTFCGAL